MIFKKIVYTHANYAFQFKSKVFFLEVKSQEKKVYSKQKQNKFPTKLNAIIRNNVHTGIFRF